MPNINEFQPVVHKIFEDLSNFLILPLTGPQKGPSLYLNKS